jgi:hypothetical protein
MTTTLDPLERLRQVQIAPRLIEEDRPVTECLEWRLSELYWNTVGTRGFVSNEVPYTVTSSGTLSANAARLLFAVSLEHPPEPRLEVLEIGSGTGLFARLFLDEFARLCEQAGQSWHRQITYYVTDRSPRSLEQWNELRLFDALPVVVARADALDPLAIETGGQPARLSSLRAVFCNYSLDSLPAAVLRKGEGGPEELCVRTHLAGDAARVKQQTSLTIEEIRKLARDPDPALIPLVGLLEFEASFKPCTRAYPYAPEVLTFGHDWPRAILNWGAIQCIETAVSGLDPHGFVLINDYGLVRVEDASNMGATQRFGGSAALGLNFPFLDHHFTSHGAVVLRPDSDERLPIHTRMVSRAAMAASAFHEIFDWSAQREQQGPQEQARQQIDAGAMEAAKHSYETALSYRRRDWVLLGEIAEFLIRQVTDYEAGLAMASAALAVNPWYSVWLWDIYGDALYALDRFEEAHEAYRRAERMEPGDPRTNLNLAYTYAQAGDHEAALQVLARGLAHDRAGVFRERLLEKQQQIVGMIQVRFNAQQEWLARRTARLGSC